MKKCFKSIGYNKRANHNVTKELQAMNSAIKATHDITTAKKLQLLDVEKVSNITNSYYHDMLQKEYTLLFNGYYETKEAFITANYETITKGFIKALALKCNVGFCLDIINKGYYNDSLYYDLSQECAMILLTNMDEITQSDCNTWIISNNLKIKCLRTINNYGYRNRTRVNNTQVALIDYDENNEQHISIAVNTRDYIEYCLSQAELLNDEQLESYFEIIRKVKFYIGINNKPKVANSCKKIINLLTQGYKKKEIANILDISSTTVTKYHNIIKQAFYEIYKKPMPYIEKIDTISDIKHNYISIDFSNCFLYENMSATLNNYHFETVDTYNNIDNIVEIVNTYHHNKMQEYYNYIFTCDTFENDNNYKDIYYFDYIFENPYIIANSVDNYYHDKMQEYYNNIFNNISFGYNINIE